MKTSKKIIANRAVPVNKLSLSPKSQKLPTSTASRSSTSPRARKLFRFGLGHERDAFLEHLATLVGSGMPMLSAIEAAGEELRSPRMKRVVSWIRDDVDDGIVLSRALRSTDLFPDQAIALIEIGEQSGKLVQNLRVVASQQEKTRQFQSRIRSAILYPVFVLALTLTIGVGIAWFILPKLAGVFSQLNLDVPTITKILIAIGNFLGAYGNIVVPLVLLFAAAVGYFLFVFPRTRHLGQSMMFAIPGIRKLMKEVEIARFTYLIGTLLQAGLTVTQAMASVVASTGLHQYRNLYQHLGARLDEGESFQSAFASYRHAERYIPRSVQQLIAVGEQSAHLAESFAKLNENYEARTETTTKDLSIILEPILLVLVWLGVVTVALAVVLPIYSLIGQFHY